MTDDLRTRIAATLYKQYCKRTRINFTWATAHPEVKKLWLADADAVLREIEPLLQPHRRPQ